MFPSPHTEASLPYWNCGKKNQTFLNLSAACTRCFVLAMERATAIEQGPHWHRAQKGPPPITGGEEEKGFLTDVRGKGRWEIDWGKETRGVFHEERSLYEKSNQDRSQMKEILVISPYFELKKPWEPNLERSAERSHCSGLDVPWALS